MAYWSVYLSKEDEGFLKPLIEKIATAKRWSFSQAVSALLREHLIEEKSQVPDNATWDQMTATAFFEGYSEKDSIYDSL